MRMIPTVSCSVDFFEHLREVPGWASAIARRRGTELRLAVCCLVFLLTSAAASAQDKRILLLFDEDRTLPGLAILDQSLRTTLTAGLGPGVQFFAESMNVSQFTDPQYEQVLREYYSNKYRGIKLDLVVAVMGPALGPVCHAVPGWSGPRLRST